MNGHPNNQVNSGWTIHDKRCCQDLLLEDSYNLFWKYAYNLLSLLDYVKECDSFLQFTFSELPVSNIIFWFNANSMSVFMSAMLVERISGLGGDFVFSYISLIHDYAFDWNNGLNNRTHCQLFSVIMHMRLICRIF